MNENNQYFSDWIKDPSHVYIGPQKRKYARKIRWKNHPGATEIYPTIIART